MKRLLLVCAAILGIGGVAAIVGTARLTREKLALRADASLDEAEFQRFLDDQHALAKEGPLPSRRGTKDAGIVLNPYLALDTDAERKADVAVWWADPTVAEKLRCQGAPKGGGPRFLDCLDTLPTGDLSVFDTLQTFDTWDLASAGAYGRYLAARPTDPLVAAPLPHYAPVLPLARLRLADGIRRGDPVGALRDVRQLAILTWTTDTLVGQMFAVAVLKTEQETYEALVAGGTLPADAWAPVSPEQQAQYKRVVFATVAVYEGLAPPDAVARLIAANPDPAGLCGAVREAIPTAQLVRGLFTSTWPGEIDLGAEIAGLDAEIASGRCAIPGARDVWLDRGRDLDLLESAENERWMLSLAHIPWARQLVGAILLNIATPDFNRYDDPAPSPVAP